jgi:hypothetical protein
MEKGAMSTLEQKAQEAAEAYRQDSITNGDHPVSAGAYAESYRDGYLAAAEPREREKAQLLRQYNATLDALVEKDSPYEAHIRELDDEIAALRERVAELEGAMSAYRQFGCGDNSCVFGSPGGMATNGGCRCFELLPRDEEGRATKRRLQNGILSLRIELETLKACANLAQPSTVGLVRVALDSAIEWMSEDGCDCGSVEDPGCALCLCRAALATYSEG